MLTTHPVISTLSRVGNCLEIAAVKSFFGICQSLAAKSLFRKPRTSQCAIFDTDILDKAILRTLKIRNRIMFEGFGITRRNGGD
jgi:hypothetical protein